MITLQSSAHQPGDWGQITESLLYQGWLDSELARSLPYATFRAHQQALIESSEHAQILLLDGGKPVGGIILMQTMDAQVGPAVIALHQFILEEYRAAFPYRKVLQEAQRIAKGVGSRFLIWTHRKPSGRIYYTYKEV